MFAVDGINISHKTVIDRGVDLVIDGAFVRPNEAGIRARQPDGVAAQRLKRSHYVFIHQSSVYHRDNIKHGMIGNATSFDHLGGDSQLFSHLRSDFSSSVEQDLIAFQRRKGGQKRTKRVSIVDYISANLDHIELWFHKNLYILCYFRFKVTLMLHKTRGIVLNYIRYRETSIIVKIYTEDFGIQSYIVNGIRSAKSKTNRIALFQPLTLLDLVVYHKNKEQTIHRLAEVKCSLPFRSLPFDFVKSSIALFETEMLVKTLREEEANPPLFHFLMEGIIFLEEANEHFENFHLQFLAKFAFYLGFGAETVHEMEQQLKENLYPHTLDALAREAMQNLILMPFEYPLSLDRQRRGKLLDTLLFYFKIHLEGLGEIRSLEVLRELMR